MISHFTLLVSISLYRLGDLLVSLGLVLYHPCREDLFQRWPVHIALALRDVGYALVFFDLSQEAVYKVVLTEDGLPLQVFPDGCFAYPLVHKLPVLFFSLCSGSAELSEYPVSDQAGMGGSVPEVAL